MNTTDLRSLLAERAHTGAPDPAADVRVAGALNRARSIHRRRRITAATTTVAAIAIAVAVIIVPSQLTASDPVPQPAGRVHEDGARLNEDGFRLYEHGRELVGSAVMESGERSVSLTVTPTALPLILVTECSGEPEIDLFVEDGQAFGGSSCNGWASQDAAGWADLGVTVGKPATFTMAIDPASTTPGRAALAAYQAMPWDAYVFPPRPDALPEMPAPDQDDVAALLESEPGDPNAPRELTLDHGMMYMDMYAQSPGVLRLRIDGVVLDPIYFWDYGYRPDSLIWPTAGDGATVPPKPADPPVQVEVIPSGFTGDWQIRFVGCRLLDNGVGCP